MKKTDLEAKIAERKQEAIDNKIISHAYAIATDDYFSKIDKKVLSDRASVSYEFTRPGIQIRVGSYVYRPMYLQIHYGGQVVFDADFDTMECEGVDAMQPLKLKKYIPGPWTEKLEYLAIHKDTIKAKEIFTKHDKLKKEKENKKASFEELKSSYKNFGICKE